MKNKIISIFVAIIILVLDIVFIVSSDITFSENENRYLESFPKFSTQKLFNGKYIDSLTNYLKDQFPLRDKFMGFKTNIEKLTLKRKINGVYLGKDNYLLEEYKGFEKKDLLVKKLNGFYEKNDVNLSLVLVPTSISFNYDKLPIFSSSCNQLDDIDYVYNNIKFNSINVYDTLNNHKNEDIFYRLDHHWTTKGAYYAYTKIINNLGFNPKEINEFEIKKVSESFNGTLYSKVNDYSLKSDYIEVYEYDNDLTINYVSENIVKTSLYEYDYLNKKDKYSMFLDNNHSLITITNNNINSDNELLVIKDSYANSIIPFLVNHYKKIHVIDPRYYLESISIYIKENNIKDVLILYNMSTINDDLGIYSIN